MAFLEYPKWLRHPEFGELIVDNAEQEAVILAGWAARGGQDAPAAVEPEPSGDAPEPAVNALTGQPKARGWPKGKPRPKKAA